MNLSTIAALQKKQAELIKQLQFFREQNELLRKENAVLRKLLDQNSSNSGKPPSSDTLRDRARRRSKRKKSKRKAGGQPGHKGHKLKKFEHVDKTQTHTLGSCPKCSSQRLEIEGEVKRQVVELPQPRVEVTEHTIIHYKCAGCGHKVHSGEELNLTQEVQYGPRLKAVISYLSVYQLIPYKRLTELVHHLFGIRISQGSISNFNKGLQKKIAPFIAVLKQAFTEHSCVFHTDETAIMVNKQVHWAHVYGDKRKTYLASHESRGRKAIDEINILPQATGTLVRDRYCIYACYDNVVHSYCNVHLLRNLKAVSENEQISWPAKIIKLLLQAKKQKAENPLTPLQIKRYKTKYEAILRAERPYYQAKEKKAQKNRCKRSSKPKRDPDHNLFNVLWAERSKVLRFMTNANVPFDNNQAERDLRMLKVKMKVSNQFKSQDWATVYTDIRSVIATAIKQGKDVLNCISKAYSEHELIRILAV